MPRNIGKVFKKRTYWKMNPKFKNIQSISTPHVLPVPHNLNILETPTHVTSCNSGEVLLGKALGANITGAK